MQVSIETMTGLERRLTISVPSEQFESQITERLADARGKVRLPGFRPGKVPLKEVRRRFGPSIRAEVAGELMQASFFDAVTQESLEPAGQPSLEVVKMDPGIDFEFTATFEVMPRIELGPFGQFAVTEPKAEISEADVDDMVQKLREQRKSFEAVERAADEGDQVKVDFEGRLDGEVFEGGTGEGVPFVIGAGQMIEDFDVGVRGLKAGEETTFDATFPEDYQAENLKGKTVQFTVRVKEVNASVLPELDDDFFQEFGVEEGGESAFRAEVRENMQREMDTAARNQVKQQVLDQLAKANEVLIPQALVHREIHNLKDRMMQQFQMPPGQKNLGFDLPDDLFQDEAHSRVKLGLLMNAVIEGNALTPDEEKVEARLAELAKPYKEAEAIISYYRSNPEQMQQIEMSVLEDQAIDLILGQSKVEALDSSYADIIADKAVPKPEPEATEDHSDGDE